LPTEWGAPASAALKRVDTPQALQFWDKGRLLSHAMGEHDKRSIVWDHIGVYARGAVWKDLPPQPLWAGGPVVNVIEPARSSIARALAQQ
jgi:hypothetical protein